MTAGLRISTLSVLVATGAALSLSWRAPPRHFAVERHPPCRAQVVDDDLGFELVMPFDDEDGATDDDDTLLRHQQMSVSISKTTPMINKTVAVLKQECHQLGLKKTGSKPMLIERLEQAHKRLARGMPIKDNEVQKSETFEWYMLQTANGFEGTVARTLRMAIDANRLKDVEKVFVPLLEGETSVRESSVMPSYIFLKMRMSKNLYQMVSNMQYVVNFVGADYGGRSSRWWRVPFLGSTAPPARPTAINGPGRSHAPRGQAPAVQSLAVASGARLRPPQQWVCARARAVHRQVDQRADGGQPRLRLPDADDGGGLREHCEAHEAEKGA